MKNIAQILVLVLLVFSCSDNKRDKENDDELLALQAELHHLKQLKTSTESKQQITTFLTFQKEDAEQAMNFYVELFSNSKILDLKRWENTGAGKEGTIMLGTFSLNGKLFKCSDSPPVHEWGFTPAISNYVECTDENELQHLFTKLSENGKVMIPLDNYGFSQKFGFVEDKFGISWQLNLQ